jgi:hypothetical protein
MSCLKENLLRQYPVGTRVELQRMNDPYSKLQPGDLGTVTAIDDMGTIFCSWDRGSGLGVLYGIDSIRKVNEQ